MDKAKDGGMTATLKKTCKRCGAAEWPCFLVINLCRMCQARRREQLVCEKIP